MAGHNAIRRITDTLAGLLRPAAPDGRSAAPPATAAGFAAPAASHYSVNDPRVREMFADRTVIAAGKLSLIGLDRIRARLGRRWPALAEMVHGIAEQTIRQHLAATDAFVRYGDVGYVILFEQLGKEEAQIKAAYVAEEISRQLLGAEMAREATDVRTVVTEISGEIGFARADPLARIAAALDSAEAGVEAAATRLEQAERAPPPAGGGPATALSAGGIRIRYRPLWDVRRKALLLFRCLPVSDHAEGHAVLGPGPEPSLTAALDGFVVRRLARDMIEMVRRGRRLPVICPVHFHTLASTRRRDAYLGLCRQIPEDLRGLITYEVIGTPPDTPQVRLAGTIPVLKPFGRAVGARLPSTQRRFGNWRDLGVEVLFVDAAADAGTPAERLASLEQFAAGAAPEGFRLGAYGLDSVALVTAVVCAGYSLAAGDAVHGIVEGPENALRFEPIDVYAGML
jgi:hypothetical protein